MGLLQQVPGNGAGGGEVIRRGFKQKSALEALF
jgi:hypothetical protein